MAHNDDFSSRIPLGIPPELLPEFFNGWAMFRTLKDTVDYFVRTASEDHDIVVRVLNIRITEVGFIKPHTLLLRGFTEEGHDASVITHFSQLSAVVVSVPKQGPERVITGFSVVET